MFCLPDFVGRKSGNTKGFKGRKLHSERTNVCSIVCSAFQLGKMYILYMYQVNLKENRPQVIGHQKFFIASTGTS